MPSLKRSGIWGMQAATPIWQRPHFPSTILGKSRTKTSCSSSLSSQSCRSSRTLSGLRTKARRMEFKDWEPHYCEILEYFGFDRAGDEKAARLLASLMPRDNLLSLAALTCDNPVTVCGNAPCLKDELGKIHGVVFAADAAADVLDTYGIRPDAVFTDLDGASDRLLALNEEGTIVVVHAHGDNIELLKYWVPR